METVVGYTYKEILNWWKERNINTDFKFENIHPFADGNDRTGRLATNYFLELITIRLVLFIRKIKRIF